MVVSHDRTLLRQMDRIVELSGLGAKVYGGGYDLYAERKAEEEGAAVRDLEQAERAMALWPNKGESDLRPAQGQPYERISPVAPKEAIVPDSAPGALRLPIVEVR